MLSCSHPVSTGTCLGRELHVLKQEFSTSAQLACGVDHSLLRRAVLHAAGCWSTSMVSTGASQVFNEGDPGLIPGSVRSPAGEMATHSNIIAWRIPWTEEPIGLQLIGFERAEHDWATEHKHGPYTPDACSTHPPKRSPDIANHPWEQIYPCLKTAAWMEWASCSLNPRTEDRALWFPSCVKRTGNQPPESCQKNQVLCSRNLHSSVSSLCGNANVFSWKP